MAQAFDEVDDLTRFADESFDTEEIDLFEFTGNDDSPLTRLKSIILSLDWEISDDILDELAEEVEALNGMWKTDKVAQVYLQGMDKVGKYLRAEGAYAHPNAIKLLLTQYYNFEKIISSPNIKGEDITALLKADIRKFKVLQYQIGVTKGVAEVENIVDEEQTQESIQEDCEPLTCLEATILGLDWEVTPESLEKFNRQADELREHFIDDKHAQILIQGLQAIGAYISDEKSKAHPDAFTLMHSFHEGLKKLITTQNLDQSQRQELLIEHVNSLNVLKEIIAKQSSQEEANVTDHKNVDQILDFNEDSTVPEQESTAAEVSSHIAAVTPPNDTGTPSNDVDDDFDFDFGLDEISDDELEMTPENVYDTKDVASLSDLELLNDTNSSNAAMETADEQYPDDVLDPAAIRPVSNKLADNLIEEELRVSGSKQNAADEELFESLIVDSDDDPATDIEDELELLFSDSELDESQGDTPTSNGSDFDDLELNITEETVDGVSADITDSSKIQSPGDGSNKDDYINFGDDLFEIEEEETSLQDESIVPALANVDEEEKAHFETSDLDRDQANELEDNLDSFFGLDDDEAVTEDNQTGLDEEIVIPALSDAPEEGGFREEIVDSELGDAPSTELEGKLDSFFGIEDEQPDIDVVAESPVVSESMDTEVDGSVLPALSDADEESEGGFREEEVLSTFAEDSSGDIQDKLDSFFGDDDSAVPANQEESGPLFEEDSTTPALFDTDEGAGFSESDSININALEESPISEIDDKLDSFFGNTETDDTSHVSAPDDKSLVGITAMFATASAAVFSSKIKEFVGREKDNLSVNQEIIISLVDGAADLLFNVDDKSSSLNAILSDLGKDFDNADQPGVVLNAVKKYTSWQKDFFEQSSLQQPVVQNQSTSVPLAGDDVIEQVSAGFAQLRKSMKEEFKAIKKELQP